MRHILILLRRTTTPRSSFLTPHFTPYMVCIYHATMS